MHVALRVEAYAHVYQLRPDIQDVGDDLRDRRFVTLTLWDRAHGNDDFAVDVEFRARRLRVAGERRLWIHDLRLAEVVSAGIKRGADADAEPAAFFLRLRPFGLPLVPANEVFS